MSRIDDLIAEHCPDGVEYKRLGDLYRIASERIGASGLDDTTYVGVDNLVPNFGGRKDAGYSVNSSGAIKYVPGNVLLGNIRPYLKKVWLADRMGGASPDVLVIAQSLAAERRITSRFLYYLLASDAFIDYSMKHAKGA